MRLSVVLPVRNVRSVVGEQLAALAAQAGEVSWELVVVDNGSTDATMEVVERFADRFPNLIRVEAADRPGPAHARNRGIAAASGEGIAFCDADDVVGDDWLKLMSEALDEHDFVAGRLDMDRLNSPWWRRQRSSPQQDRLQQVRTMPTAAAGANLGVRRWVHEAVGGFREDLVAFSDTDYCWRIQRELGVDLVFVPEMVVHYRFRADVLNVLRQASRYQRAGAQLARIHGHYHPADRPWLIEVARAGRLAARAPGLVLGGEGARLLWLIGSWWGRQRARIDRRRGVHG